MSLKLLRITAALSAAAAGCGGSAGTREGTESADLQGGTVFRDCAACPHVVVLQAADSRAFAVGVYEVTFEEWDACLADGGCGGYRPSDEGWGRGRRPVINVSWQDAQSYVRWLSGKTGEEYRLLSEAEWAYAARTRPRRGSEEDPSARGLERNRIAGAPRPVGSYGANGFGVYDMHGNVWEWVQDCWSQDYEAAPAAERIWGSGDCSRRVLRGGSWVHDARASRSMLRDGDRAELRNNDLGFRVARTLAP